MTFRLIADASRYAVGRGGRAAVAALRFGIERTAGFPPVPDLPPGRMVELDGRGELLVVDSGTPRNGDPDAPVLLLFHGLATTAYLTWFSTLDDLVEEHRVVMLDQRWHGRGIVSERFDLAECADDAAAVLDLLGIDEVIAVGYSMGGALAQVFWRRHPERTAGLVLASTLARWKTNLVDELFYPALGTANTRLRDGYRRRVDGFRARLPAPGSEVDAMTDWAWAEFRSTSAWALPEVLGALGEFDSREWLPGVDVPTAVVVTGSDQVLPHARQRQMAGLIPGATVHEAPGGHASVVFDLERWRPVFLEAVHEVVDRVRMEAHRAVAR